MNDCIFCKIIAGEIPATIVYNSDTVVGFRDINPVAPTHILFVPKKHFATLNDLGKNEMVIMSDILNAITETAKKEGIDTNGYRVITNVNRDAGQEVFHLHVHLIGGRALGKMG